MTKPDYDAIYGRDVCDGCCLCANCLMTKVGENYRYTVFPGVGKPRYPNGGCSECGRHPGNCSVVTFYHFSIYKFDREMTDSLKQEET